MMGKVICDTNVWYYLGSGKIAEGLVKNYKLVATWVNIVELGYAHPRTKIDFSIKDWKNAARAILMYSDEIIELDPFEFSTEKIYPGHFQHKNRDLQEVLRIISDSDNTLKEEQYKSNEKYFDMYMRIKDGFKATIENYRTESRPQIVSSKTAKQKYKDSQEIEALERVKEVIWDVEEYIKRDHKKIIEFDNETEKSSYFNHTYSSFKFHILTKQRYLRNILLQGKMSIHPNDFGDLTNLLYVGKSEQYWTEENRWSSIIKEAGLGDRLITRQILN